MSVPIEQAIKRAWEAKAELEKAQAAFCDAEDRRIAAAGELRSALQDLKPSFEEAMMLIASILPEPKSPRFEQNREAVISPEAQAVLASQPEGLNPPGRQRWPTSRYEDSL